MAAYEREVAAAKQAHKAGTTPQDGSAWMYGIACLRMVTGMGPRLGKRSDSASQQAQA